MTQNHAALDSALVHRTAEALERTGRFGELRRYAQHGACSVYEHSIRVACTALKLARRLAPGLNRDALVRGALLHDYFLYDWHIPDPTRPKHAFYHPRVALRNALRDYALSDTETDVILRHMFPLVPIPPRTREGWIVCLADTWCALGETVNRRRLAGIAARLFGPKAPR